MYGDSVNQVSYFECLIKLLFLGIYYHVGEVAGIQSRYGDDVQCFMLTNSSGSQMEDKRKRRRGGERLLRQLGICTKPSGTKPDQDKGKINIFIDFLNYSTALNFSRTTTDCAIK